MARLPFSILRKSRDVRGALIIGVCIIIGLNLPLAMSSLNDAFSGATSIAEAAWDEVSGRAEQRRQYWREMTEKQFAEANAAEARRRAEAEERAAYRALKVALVDGWQKFLLSVRGDESPEVGVVVDEKVGDYMCLGKIFASGKSLVRLSPSRKDHFADAFVIWLNSNAVGDKTDWQYRDLAGREFQTSYDSLFIPGARRDACVDPNGLFRMNRFERHID